MGFKLKNNNTRRCTGSTCHGRCGYTRSCRVVPVRRPTTPGGKARYTSKSRHDIEVQRAGWVSKVSESGTRTARLALSEGRSVRSGASDLAHLRNPYPHLDERCQADDLFFGQERFESHLNRTEALNRTVHRTRCTPTAATITASGVRINDSIKGEFLEPPNTCRTVSNVARHD